MRSIKISLLILLSAALAACAVSEDQCDPSNADAGFATKFGCKTQGVYAKRVEKKEQILLDEQKTNQMFREVYAAIEQERAQVGRDLGEQQRTAANLNRSLNALLGELKQKAAGNSQIEAEIASLEKDMATINQQDSPAVLQRQMELQKLHSKVVALESDLGLR